MEDLGRPRRQRSAKLFVAWTLFVSTGFCPAQVVAVSPQWLASFPAAASGKPSQATAVPIDGESLMVSVVAAGSDAGRPALRLGNNPVPVQLVGFDPVSRLGFYKPGGNIVPKPVEWRDDAGPAIGANLRAMTPGGMVACRSNGWVKQVGKNILPLALLKVNFGSPVPPPGTPLLDDEGRVAAIIFQDSGTGNTGYAIPAEAVHRVRRDIPQIVRVLPNSPAAAVGIKPSDVLLNIGSRQISDYADAANAFFYLIPGQAVRVKLLRGADQHEFTLTPTKPPEK
jgi:membrane-associated protease RseP (regulator of RpoE activity)